jgi:ferredoxin-nitrite reductase
MKTADFTLEQKQYLSGLFAGAKARGVTFADISSPESSAPAGSDDSDLCKEERLKKVSHPLDAYTNLLEDARANAAPDADDAFRFKWNGLFWLNPVHEGYMCRLRIPGGVVTSPQLRELASIVDELTTGYVQITTRANFQIRAIQPRDCPAVLRRIQHAGLHSRGAGADNVRNLTATPTSGFDPYELIDVMPFVNELSDVIVNTREFYDLPRKFNIAFDGGGLISAVEDTNDIGFRAVRIVENAPGIAPGVYFRVCLGGVTGHKTFARDWGVLIPPEEVTETALTILRVFIRDGDRTNRKTARLKYLIEKRGLTEFRKDCESLRGRPFLLMDAADPAVREAEHPAADHPHVGVYPQRDPGLCYVGAFVPVGQISSVQLRGVADLADRYGRGEVRLTVWQNLLIPYVSQTRAQALCEELGGMGLETRQSHLRSGFVACTGNKYCKYASTDTKGHAIQLMEELEQRVTLDQPVNIHLTGCPHSCAQHYMGDIGLLGTKVKLGEDCTVEGYHVTLGGGFGAHQNVGRQIYSSVPFEELPRMLSGILSVYLTEREGNESFQSFCNRHGVDELKALFAEAAHA